MTAKYKCGGYEEFQKGCGMSWSFSSPQNHYCPYCKSVWVTWVNYEEWSK